MAFATLFIAPCNLLTEAPSFIATANPPGSSAPPVIRLPDDKRLRLFCKLTWFCLRKWADVALFINRLILNYFLFGAQLCINYFFMVKVMYILPE
jgi:hypothetical protein